MSTTRKTRTKPVTLSAVIAKIAERKGVEPVKAGKTVRSYIRRHDSDLRDAFNWPPTEKERADGNRYPAMPAKAARHLLETLG